MCNQSLSTLLNLTYRFGLDFVRFPKDLEWPPDRPTPEPFAPVLGLIFLTLPLIERRRFGLASVSERSPAASFGLPR